MSAVQPTNICCIDVQPDCVEYLKGLGLNVYEGSFGSVYKIDWTQIRHHSEVPVLVDMSLPDNLQEYHVFVHDMSKVGIVV